MPRVNVKDQRKQQLIDANLQCIARLGLEHTTIADVSKAAGMSRGIVNFYFESKERMMLETLKSLIEDYTAQVEKAVEKDGAMEGVMAAHFSGRLSGQKWLICWHAFAGQAATQKDYRKLMAGMEAQLLIRLTGALEQTAAQQLLIHLRGCWLSLLLSPDALPKDAMIESCRVLVQLRLRSTAEVVELAAHKPARKREESTPQLDFGDLFGTIGR